MRTATTSINFFASTESIFSTDNHQRLLNDVRKYNVLSEDEEKALFRAYYATDSESERTAIRNEVISHHSRFIALLAHKLGGRDGEKVCEAFSIIGEAFCRCFPLYDMSKGIRFITFAKDWARTAHFQYRRDKGSLVRNGKADLVRMASEYANKTYVREGRTASDAEVLEYVNGIVEEQNKKAKKENKATRKLASLADLSALSATSLETPMGEDGNFESVGEFATATASQNLALVKENKEHQAFVVARCLACLTDQERKVISLAYGITLEGTKVRAMSDEKIAHALHYTKERIRQVRKGAETKMRDFATRHRLSA